jgi:hypothetical protein
MVQLVPVAAVGGERPLGLLAGKAKESADCWTSDEEVEQWFYGAATRLIRLAVVTR